LVLSNSIKNFVFLPLKILRSIKEMLRSIF
jgi:hypothetical protein